MAYSGGVGYNPRRKPRRRSAVGGGVSAGGGVGAKQPSPKPQTPTGPALPPHLTYDPGIAAQLRASERGLEDTEVDVRAKRHFANRDLAQALRDIRTSTSRSRGDINRSAARGEQKIGESESAVQLKAGRANQDFDTQLANIGRQFAQLGQRQGESANAAGVLGSGTAAAAQAARSRNQQLAEAPIATARQRVGEDLATALRQLGVSRGELGADRERELGELLADRDRGRKLSRRQTGRTKFGLKHELERARREKEFAVADLTQQAIYEARNNHPGAFSRSGKRKGRRR